MGVVYCPDVIFDTRKDAEEALLKMEEFIDLYGIATVDDLYRIAEVDQNEPDSHIRGWITVYATEIVPARDGYILVMPRPVLIPDDSPNEAKAKVEAEERYIQNDIKLTKELYEDAMVNKPPHYQSETGLETIDVIEAFTFHLKGIEATDTGNVLKYMCRWKGKNGLQDLKKARWYLDHLISHVELLEKENTNE